jgi:hypothetical protein
VSRARWTVAIAAIAGAAAALCSAGCGGCGSKSDGSSGPSPDVTGLAAVPASAEVIIGVDVAKLSGSPLVERAVDQLLLRDPVLQQGWQEVHEGCKIDIGKQVRHVVLAIGPHAPGARPGTGPVLMIATGTLPEHDLTQCITKIVGKGNGSVTGRETGGRTLYQVKDGTRTMFLAYGRADTVIMGTSDAYVTDALGTGPKATANPDIASWLKLVDQNAPIWGVGRLDEQLKGGLPRVTNNEVKAGPSAIVGWIDPANGAKADLGVVMSTPADAKALETWTENQRKGIVSAVQGKSLAITVSKISIAAENNILHLRANLTIDDVNQLLSVLDGGKPAEQISPPTSPTSPTSPAESPPTGSGSSASP